ncbi:hypothetical protein GOM49_10455 [Clostridium bovifaecis]|uniref:HNH endonuclease n=1 Tax=Clostridium bovifaecis TaxID=2184719 RepID=A0A6I6F2M2_9CLOT|nr:hypothetical protein GOM49_10455 [Clostridium bovifaecis]
MSLQNEKKFAILMSIIDIGGNGTKKEVLDNINKNNYLYFTQEDLKLKENRPEIHWRNDLAFIRKKLVVDKYIDDSEKNNWKITDKGKQYLIALSSKIIKDNKSNFKKLTENSIERADKFINEYVNEEINMLRNIDKLISATVDETEKEQLIKIRIGQGIFKRKLLSIDCKCKICGLEEQSLLIASHIKPWKYSDSNERLDVNNGFLLCPTHDALFDKGYITFYGDGLIMISDLINESQLGMLNINNDIRISFNDSTRQYIKWHRENEFNKLKADFR